ncbi:MAG: polysulfide reductase NrfD [Roseiflexaceae bacterium]|nr:polysulfide reductase NrfD [Roseiflexaceae bacterium]
MAQSLKRPALGPVDPDALLAPGLTNTEVSRKLAGIPMIGPRKTPLGWLTGFAFALLLLMVYLTAVAWLLIQGVGIWGINVPIGWGMDIINFVWWIGIGHAGTLISAILLLLRQKWRTSINRFAEAMTLFAVACAGVYPILHLGRPYLFYWMLPYPSSLGMWPQYQSPLEWDVFAISTYATVSLLFWLVGLIPDIATMRDRSTNPIMRFFWGFFALGWRGSAKHWHRYELASLLLAGLSTPLVVSVHTIVSFDFAIGQVPGWHATIFPPYFVAGAVFAGFAMVMLLMIPVRKFYGLEQYITMKHFDLMAKVTLATGLIVVFGYAMEAFFAWFSGNQYESFLLNMRLFGPYAWSYYALLLCNFLIPQVFWFKWARQSIPVLLFVSLVVSIGMWLERFVIIVVSLSRDFIPSSWGYYNPTIWDWLLYLGSFGLFFTFLFLFSRFVPMISIFEMRMLVNEQEGSGHADTHGAGAGTGAQPAAAD